MLTRREVRVRLLEKRSGLLQRFLTEHGLKEPKSVEFSPLNGAVEGRCFLNVEAQVARAGGTMETGWVFWETENISLHTEGHAIWVTPQNRRQDITPRRFPPERRILFLPDKRVETKRGYTAGYRTILSDDPKVRAIELYSIELSKLFDEHFAGMGKMMEIPTALFREAAARVGLPDQIARAMVQRKIQNFGMVSN